MTNQKNDRATTPRIAVLGCGGWGRNIVRTLQGVQGVDAVVDPTETGRATAKDLAPDATIHAEPSAVFADETIDAVMIATPAETHFDLAKRAIEAGKDVFVEKPLTTDLEEARALVQLAEAHDRVLMVGHLLEYHPAVLRLHELINEGELGEVRYLVSNRLNLGKVRTEENALWSFAPHDIAVILRLVGADPERVVATGAATSRPASPTQRSPSSPSPAACGRTSSSPGSTPSRSRSSSWSAQRRWRPSTM